MRIKPAQGLIVRDPVTKAAIPEEGVEVSEFDLYWAARLRDGDVECVDSAASAAHQEDPLTPAGGSAETAADDAVAQAKSKSK